MKSFILFLALFCLACSLDNGLGRTPQMGWNSWNKFRCNINEALIKQTVDLLVSTGLAAKGYKYVNLDDCWQIDRNKTTNEIIQDKSKFPSGMAVLGKYIHEKGLLFGLYSDAGYKTCQGRPGSLGYETYDANTYAKWEVDYLKYDNCNNDHSSAKTRYPAMRDALNKSGRAIFFSMCSWGQEIVWEWAQPVGNSWRTTGDIRDNYASFLSLLDKQKGLSKYAAPGGWNDPDMLEVGNGGMQDDEYQAHFALWAALKAPLLIGCSLKDMSKQTLKILGNEEVIAVNQDPLGIQADVMDRDGNKQIWGGPLSQNRYVFVCFNRGTQLAQFELIFEELIPSKVPIRIREIITKKDVQLPKTHVFRTQAVRGHSVAMYVVTYKNA